jgi:hypothetical protein
MPLFDKWFRSDRVPQTQSFLIGSLVRIGQLSVGQRKPVYRRSSGELYLKLNDESHVRVRLENTPRGMSWIGDGRAEVLDQNEIIDLIQY